MVIVDAQTVQLSATYVEPTKSVDGSALADLAYTSIYYQIGTQAPVRAPQQVASALAGGGKITSTLLVPVPAGVRASVLTWVTATDTTGNESAPSAKVTFVVDRVSPAPPDSFSVA